MFQSFAAMQNCTSLEESIKVFQDLCIVSLNKDLTHEVIEAKEKQSRQFRKRDEIEQMENDELQDDFPEVEDCTEGKTIKKCIALHQNFR